MIPHDDVWNEVHVRRSNREVAARWMHVGSLPIVLSVGAFLVEFDGARLTITTHRFRSEAA